LAAVAEPHGGPYPAAQRSPLAQTVGASKRGAFSTAGAAALGGRGRPHARADPRPYARADPVAHAPAVCRGALSPPRACALAATHAVPRAVATAVAPAHGKPHAGPHGRALCARPGLRNDPREVPSVRVSGPVAGLFGHHHRGFVHHRAGPRYEP
jgi:hypothetical protein